MLENRGSLARFPSRPQGAPICCSTAASEKPLVLVIVTETLSAGASAFPWGEGALGAEGGSWNFCVPTELSQHSHSFWSVGLASGPPQKERNISPSQQEECRCPWQLL